MGVNSLPKTVTRQRVAGLLLSAVRTGDTQLQRGDT